MKCFEGEAFYQAWPDGTAELSTSGMTHDADDIMSSDALIVITKSNVPCRTEQIVVDRVSKTVTHLVKIDKEKCPAGKGLPASQKFTLTGVRDESESPRR